MSVPEVVVHRDPLSLADAVAARLVTHIVEAQAARDVAHVVITGGGIGTAVLSSVGTSPARDAVDWSRVHVWWGDERFLPTGDPDRNETLAREALLDVVPVRHVHAVPGPDRVDTVLVSAQAYAEELARYAEPEAGTRVPGFDVLLLGVGEDAHVASLFPGSPGLQESERTVVPVTGSPKPPPVRVSLTVPAICAACEVWLVAAGGGKAPAVRLALDERAGAAQVPAAAVRGRRRTLWFLDEEAAAQLPPGLEPRASP